MFCILQTITKTKRMKLKINGYGGVNKPSENNGVIK